FLDQKFKEHGGGFTMIADSEQSAQYTRIDPISISMPNDGYLILEVAEKGLTETAGLPVEEINGKLMALDFSDAEKRRFEIPLEKISFGWLSNRRGGWRALKTLKKSTGKIRILCQDKVNCISGNRQTNGEYVDLYMADELQREKTFKALKHLIGLYQHRKELF
ncbi:MAG: hypothetical protein OQK13_05055, partial [Gammaproteobacteria bacterium]|nr:hypothetical protein [Gammaproteobacteria bacterium]